MITSSQSHLPFDKSHKICCTSTVATSFKKKKLTSAWWNDEYEVLSIIYVPLTILISTYCSLEALSNSLRNFRSVKSCVVQNVTMLLSSVTKRKPNKFLLLCLTTLPKQHYFHLTLFSIWLLKSKTWSLADRLHMQSTVLHCPSIYCYNIVSLS